MNAQVQNAKKLEHFPRDKKNDKFVPAYLQNPGFRRSILIWRLKCSRKGSSVCRLTVHMSLERGAVRKPRFVVSLLLARSKVPDPKPRNLFE